MNGEPVVDLQEEYWVRNKIQTPLVKFRQLSVAVIQRYHNGPIDKKYEIFTSTLSNKEGSPGTFEVRFYSPARNQHKQGRNFYGSLIKDVFIPWEDYEDWVRIVAKDIKSLGHFVLSSDNIVPALWEIFILQHDSILAELHAGCFSLVEKIAESFDAGLSATERLLVINQIISSFANYASWSSSSGLITTLRTNWNNMLSNYTSANTDGTWLSRI